MSGLAKKIVEANEKLLEEGNTDVIKDFFSDKYVVHFSGTSKSGYNMIHGFVNSISKSFSSLRVEVESLVESDDRIAWQRTIRAKQTGSFQGFPASDKEIVWRDMVVSRFESDLIVEEWVVTDLAEELLRSRKP